MLMFLFVNDKHLRDRRAGPGRKDEVMLSVEKIKEEIDWLFSDTSVSQCETANRLAEIVEHCATLAETLVE